MALADIIREGKGRAGSGGAWRVYGKELWHYSTLMLKWEEVGENYEDVYMSTGHGSVSDQHGMNVAFRTLGLPFRMDCDWKGGGPRFTELCTCDRGTYNANYPHDPSLCDPEQREARRLREERRQMRARQRRLHSVVKPQLEKIIEKTA